MEQLCCRSRSEGHSCSKGWCWAHPNPAEGEQVCAMQPLPDLLPLGEVSWAWVCCFVSEERPGPRCPPASPARLIRTCCGCSRNPILGKRITVGFGWAQSQGGFQPEYLEWHHPWGFGVFSLSWFCLHWDLLRTREQLAPCSVLSPGLQCSG